MLISFCDFFFTKDINGNKINQIILVIHDLSLFFFTCLTQKNSKISLELRMLEELEERKRLIQEELSQTGMRPNVLRISENNKGNLKKKIAVNSMKSTLN